MRVALSSTALGLDRRVVRADSLVLVLGSIKFGIPGNICFGNSLIHTTAKTKGFHLPKLAWIPPLPLSFPFSLPAPVVLHPMPFVAGAVVEVHLAVVAHQMAKTIFPTTAVAHGRIRV